MGAGGCNIDKNSHRAETIQTRFRDYRSQEDHRRVRVRLCPAWGDVGCSTILRNATVASIWSLCACRELANCLVAGLQLR